MQAVLQYCIDIEERVGEIYRTLADSPEADGELRAIWLEMADDELRHARRVRLVVDRLEMAGLRDCGLSPTEALALFDRAGEILQDAVEGRLSVEDAVFAAVELEDAFLAVHLAYAAAEAPPDLRTMFKALAEADREHTARLRSYLDRRHDGHGLEFDGEGEQP